MSNSDDQSQLQAKPSKETPFILTGFNNWKKALEKFKNHQNSLCHKASLTYEEVLPQCGGVREMSDKTLKTERELNYKCLMVTIENLQYLSRQGLPFRGHNDCESNFYQLLLLRSKDILELKSWFMKKNGKYIFHDIQNELLSIMSHQVLNKLLVSIRDTMFSLICGEYTDCSNKELLTFYLRWVTDNLDVFELYMGFYEIPDIKSSTTVSVIKDIVIRFQLQFNKCRGQCYDGASHVLVKKSGVAIQIEKLQPKAHCTHCHGHSISLSVKVD